MNTYTSPYLLATILGITSVSPSFGAEKKNTLGSKSPPSIVSKNKVRVNLALGSPKQGDILYPGEALCASQSRDNSPVRLPLSEGLNLPDIVEIAQKKLKTLDADTIDSTIQVALYTSGGGFIDFQKLHRPDWTIPKTQSFTLGPVENHNCEYRFQVERRNGLNSQLAVTNHREQIVQLLAWKLNDAQGKSHIYTPYSRALEETDLIEEGQDYLKGLVSTTLTSPSGTKILHRFTHPHWYNRLPGFREKDVLPGLKERLMRLSQVIHIIEHQNPQDYPKIPLEKRREYIEAQIPGILAVIGANKEKAYQVTPSDANATGLSQIIPSTWAILQTTYPDIMKDIPFDVGARDPRLSILGQLLHIHLEWGVLLSNPRVSEFLQAEGAPWIDSLLLAGYNMRVNRLTKKLDMILQNRGTKSLDTLYGELLVLLPEETQIYIEKGSIASEYITRKDETARELSRMRASSDGATFRSLFTLLLMLKTRG